MTRVSDDDLRGSSALAPKGATPVLRFPTESLPVAADAEREYTALFARMYEPLVRYAFAELRDQDAAEDLVQGAFVSVWNQYYRVKIRPGDEPDLLLYRIVKFRLHNYRRDQSRYRIRLNTHLSMWTGRAKRWMIPSEYVEHAELVSVIDNAISKMSPRSREIFVMRREAGMSYKEIAGLLAISEVTVDSLMHKAQLVLRKHVERAGFGSATRRNRLPASEGREP